jgi:hypothetical protein
MAPERGLAAGAAAFVVAADFMAAAAFVAAARCGRVEVAPACEGAVLREGIRKKNSFSKESPKDKRFENGGRRGRMRTKAAASAAAGAGSAKKAASDLNNTTDIRFEMWAC